MHNDFVTFDEGALAITVQFADKPPLIIHQHDPNLSISHFSHGHGGQNVNKHQNGVRFIYTVPESHRHPDISEITIEVRCHEQRHQHANLVGAFRHLAEKLHDYFYVAPPRFQTKIPYRARAERMKEKHHRSKKKSLRQSSDLEDNHLA